MGDIFGKILGVILAFILCIMAPLTVIAMSDDMADRRAIYADITAFVDQTIDTGNITDLQLKEFLYAVSSHGPVCDVKIVRQMRVVNPDPKGGTVVTYVPMDVFLDGVPMHFNQGDLIQVSVEAVEYTGAQRIARMSIGVALQPIAYSIAGRVR